MDPAQIGTPAATATRCAPPPTDDLFADCLDSLDSPRPADIRQPDATTDARAARRLKRAVSLAALTEPCSALANPPASTALSNPLGPTAPNTVPANPSAPTALLNPPGPAAAPNSTAPLPAAGAIGAAPKPPNTATRAPRHPPSSLPPDLPATAQEVTDHASLSRVVTLLTTIIVKAVQDGKSVTASNKRLIVVAAEETRKAMAVFQRLNNKNTDPTCSTVARSTPELTGATETDITSASITTTATIDILKNELSNCTREIKKLRVDLATVSVSAPGVHTPTTYAQIASRNVLRPTGSPAHHHPTASVETATASCTIPRHKPAIVITPKESCKTRQEVVTAWRDSISFKESNYAPSRVQPLSNNKLRVEFETPTQRDDVLRRLGRPETKVSAEPARRLMPMLILKGISKDIKSEELVEILSRQNPDLNDPDSDPDSNHGLKIRFLRSNRNPQLYNAVLVASPGVWRKAIAVGKLNVDHQKVHIQDFSPFIQCFSCLQFNHTKKNCRSGSITPCAYCAGTDHGETDCPSKTRKAQPKCYNCSSRNAKFNLTVVDSHKATSLACPLLRTMKKRVEEKIDYGF